MEFDNCVILIALCSNSRFHFSTTRLSSLQHLSVDSNQLTELPVEMCALLRLEEFHVANNQLTSLPLEFGFLVNLEKLYLQKNKIRELPEVFQNKNVSDWPWLCIDRSKSILFGARYEIIFIVCWCWKIAKTSRYIVHIHIHISCMYG